MKTLKELSRYPVGTFADIVYRNALLYADKEAFVYQSEKITFSQYNQRVNTLIHALQDLGFKKGDVIGVLSWNCIDYIYVYGAAMKGGFIASPFNTRLQLDELKTLINYSCAKALFVGPELVETAKKLKEFLPQVKQYIALEASAPGMLNISDLMKGRSSAEPEVQISEDDNVFIFYTSGTTGVPRGALYTHRHAMEDTRKFVSALRLEGGTRYLGIMPFFHIGGTKVCLGHFYSGGRVFIAADRSFNPATFIQTIAEEKITDIHVVPTHLVAIFNLPDIDKYQVSSLQRVHYAGSPMPVEILRRGIAKWGLVFVQIYGSTEVGPNTTYFSQQQHDVLDKSPEDQKVLMSAGLPIIGTHIRIVDNNNNDVEPGVPGEIIIESKSNMVEWWHKPEETQETIINNWLHTGDIGTYDEKGYIYIVDRKKDMIISGGENIYPREIEEIVYQHPAVKEAAVIGIPDPYWVEKVHAVVSLREGASLTEKELIEYCRERMARYKAPKSVEIINSLPKSPAGKILKREIREKYWQGFERKIA
jgi:long-chain acyl-CoA synthetase